MFSPSVHPDTGKPYELHKLEGFTGMESLVACPDVQLTKKGDTYTISETANIPASLSLSGEIPEGERDNTLTSWCARWYAKGLNAEEIALFAHALNAAMCKPPLPAQQVEKIVKSIGRTHERAHPLAMNINGLRNWLDLQTVGTFTIADVFQQLGIRTQYERESILLELKALRDQGLIENAGKSTSTFRKVTQDIQQIDLSKDDQGAVIPMNLLFALHRNIEIRQKNIIVIAGESNAGKTAFLFNIVYLNQKHHKFRYITSEMTADEINSRIKKLRYSPEDFSKFCTFYSKTHDYSDAIDPEGINIVDFLEVYEDFYRVGAEIKKVFDKLTTGCAFIALQKKRGEMFGRGGEFTIEKARLAISLFTHGHLKNGIVGSAMITKCKNFIGEMNPDHQEIFYALRKGAFYETSLHGVFDGSKRYFTDKARKQLIDKIQQYCRMQQNKDAGDETIDAYCDIDIDDSDVQAAF